MISGYYPVRISTSSEVGNYEYWWFFLFILLLSAIAEVFSEQTLEIVLLIVLMPLIAAGTRRLRDTGESGWWQLLALVPFGVFVVLYFLARESEDEAGQADTKRLKAG